ncbi:GntR family transcriptional regulator [Xylophilus sp. GOD-11R]|uniref:GntR family transcriptional regulator n=1 Tax=Xylophilus sp. GOD-11R TaxID=3089814 RepID=UPI00298BCFF8|nr:GntR family transcriptional regulator [Xylophilus sp. GOD-11R]WPB57330.1 GntR family transcriptional regulator [Xylophilus sp. GOD-11R]
MSPSPSETRAQSASDVVFFGIVNGLETQGFVPAQRLVETDLAVQFGVGRNSVREALARLAAEGIVELQRNKGAAVRSFSLQDTLDVLDVAERMTGLLARAAARHAKASGLIATLRGVLKEVEAADAAGKDDDFAVGRRRFYRTLLDMAGSRELKRLFPAIHMSVVYAQHRLPALRRLRTQDYRQIAQAVVAGDEARADEAGCLHVAHVRDEILRQGA